jgi:hypothetical protein
MKRKIALTLKYMLLEKPCQISNFFDDLKKSCFLYEIIGPKNHFYYQNNSIFRIIDKKFIYSATFL